MGDQTGRLSAVHFFFGESIEIMVFVGAHLFLSCCRAGAKLQLEVLAAVVLSVCFFYPLQILTSLATSYHLTGNRPLHPQSQATSLGRYNFPQARLSAAADVHQSLPGTGLLLPLQPLGAVASPQTWATRFRRGIAAAPFAVLFSSHE